MNSTARPLSCTYLNMQPLQLNFIASLFVVALWKHQIMESIVDFQAPRIFDRQTTDIKKFRNFFVYLYTRFLFAVPVFWFISMSKQNAFYVWFMLSEKSNRISLLPLWYKRYLSFWHRKRWYIDTHCWKMCILIFSLR